MNKKILIASFFAAVILMVPFGSVASAPSEESEALSQDVIESIYVIPDYILEELYDLIDILLLYFGNNPEIVVICNQLLDIISNDIHDALCDIILTPIFNLMIMFWNLLENAQNNIEFAIYFWAFFYVADFFMTVQDLLNCGDWSPPGGMILSTLQENLNIVQGQTVGCPCNQ